MSLVYQIAAVRDLAPVDCAPFGRDPAGQRFIVQASPTLRRGYFCEVRGATTPGAKVLELLGPDGTVAATSEVFVVLPQIAHDILLRKEMFAPAYGEITLRIVDVPMPELSVSPAVTADAGAVAVAPSSAAAEAAAETPALSGDVPAPDAPPANDPA